MEDLAVLNLSDIDRQTTHHADSHDVNSHDCVNNQTIYLNSSIIEESSLSEHGVPLSSHLSADDDSILTVNNSKRQKIIDELYDTEKSYLSDITVLKKVYYDETVLSPADTKILFSNLLAVIKVSTKIIADLQEISVGQVFLENALVIQTTYCDYLTKNEAAMNKLVEFSSPDSPPHIKEFFKTRQAMLAGKTNAWDFSSLLIKPVQRVLKYPLLLRQLVKETPETDLDYSNLIQAVEKIDAVAEKINAAKKRLEIVEKVVTKSSLNVIHGINKKISRGAQQIKNAASGDMGDVSYDALRARFDFQLKNIATLGSCIHEWIGTIQATLTAHSLISVYFAETFENDASDGLQAYAHGVDILKSELPLIQRATRKVMDMLEAAEMAFKNPLKVMRKRDAKQLDFSRARDLQARGEEIDKSLKESCEAYEALNSQLCEELPLFFAGICHLVDVILCEFASVQSSAYLYFVRQLENLIHFNARPLVGGGLASLQVLQPWCKRINDTGSDENSIIANKIPTTSVWSQDQSTTDDPIIRKVALYDFTAELEDELNLVEGQDVEIIEDSYPREGWTLVYSKEGLGYVPDNYIQ